MKITRARSLAVKLDGYQLINNWAVFEVQTAIAELLFSDPQLTDSQIVDKVLGIDYEALITADQ